MTWRVWLMVVLLVGCSESRESSNTLPPFSTHIEAEADTNTIFGFATRSTCDTCSGGHAVDSLGWSGRLEVPVTVPAAGEYELRLRYSLGMNETRGGLISVNDFPVTAISLEQTGAWGQFRVSIIRIPLAKGLNRIGFGNPSSWFVPLDWIELSSQYTAASPEASNTHLLLPSRSLFVLANTTTLTLPLIFLVVSCLVALLLIASLWHQAREPHGMVSEFLLIVLGCLLTMLGYLLELLDATLLGSWLGYNLRQLALCLTSVVSMRFTLKYVGWWDAINPGIRSGLVGFGVLCVFLYATDPWLHLVTIHPQLTLEQPYLPFRRDDDGIGHMIAYVTAAILMFTAMGVLIAARQRLSMMYRTQMTYLTVALVSPFVVGYLVAYPLTRRGIGGDLSWNMFGVGLSVWLLTYVVYKTGFPQRHPALWGQAATIPSDLAVVIDTRGRVVECNEAARQGLSLVPYQALGLVLPESNTGIATLHRRHFEITRTPLFANKVRDGTLVTLHDVTDRVSTEATLRDNQAQLLALQEELHAQAMRDALTGLYNRRYFDTAFAASVDQAQRTGTDLSLILIDIDLFRDINARFGHAGGDQVLQHISQLLLDAVPTGACVCRYGGEEFSVLLPEIPVAEAEHLAHTWQLRLLEYPAMLGPDRVEVRLSAACASLLEHGADAMLLVNDDALREAKRRGRNRVIRARHWNPHWGQGWL